MNNAQKFIKSEFEYVERNSNAEFNPRIRLFSTGLIDDGITSKHIRITWDQFEAIKQLLIDTSESE